MSEAARCFECSDLASEMHHVIPQSRGGTKTVPLCGACHDLVHDRMRGRRDDISALTSAALQAKKARGERLGRPRKLPVEVRARIFDDSRDGKSMNSIANQLTAEGICTAHGGQRWYASTVQRVLESIELDIEIARITDAAS